MQGILLCFSLTDRKSFDLVGILHEDVVKSCPDSLPDMVLTGCKSDLETDREVTFDEASVPISRHRIGTGTQAGGRVRRDLG